MSDKKRSPKAKLIIRGAAKMNGEEAVKISNWLYQQWADFIREGHNYSKVFTATIE
jgi:hypothetical protein